MNDRKFNSIIILALSVLVLSSCSLGQGKPKPFPDLSQTYLITISDSLDGLPSPTIPLNSLYTLESTDTGFEGAAFFSVGGSGGNDVPLQATSKLTIPDDVVASFLQKLGEVHPEIGKYEPPILLDNYPRVVISLVYGDSESVEFYSISPSDENIPWQVTYDGQTYIIMSGIPAEAFGILKPYLSQDVLQKLIAQTHW